MEAPSSQAGSALPSQLEAATLLKLFCWNPQEGRRGLLSGDLACGFAIVGICLATVRTGGGACGVDPAAVGLF